MNMVSNEKLFRIKGFDGMRALAVIMVWLEHRSFLNGSGIGGLGVSMFFVLSGFLIVDILRRQRENIELGRSSVIREWRIFLIRRAYRIFPVYFIFLSVIGLGCFLRNGGIDFTAVFMHAFYLVNGWVVFISGWNETTSHLWSLSVEEQFYFVFPIFALVFPSNRLVFVCVVISGMAACIGCYFIFNDNEIAANLIGFGFAKIALGGGCVLFFSARIPKNGKSFVTPTILLFCYVVALPFMSMFGFPVAVNVIKLIPLSAIVAIIVCFIHGNQSSLLVKALEWTPLKMLGVVSYGFYVFHYPLSGYLIGDFLHYDIDAHIPKLIKKLGEFALPCVLAYVSWRYIEQPILKLRPIVIGGSHELPESNQSICSERTLS